MRPLIQIGKKICFVIKYIVLYVVVSFIFISFFATLYWLFGVNNSFEYSLNVFWGIANEINMKIYCWTIGEVVVSNLFNTIIVTCVLIRFLKPLNPIIMSKYIVYNTKKNRFHFRYWIMLPEGKFLFDAKLRVVVTTPEAHEVGINTLQSKWESKDDKVLNLGQIRGIRYLELNKEESQELLEYINNQKYNITEDRLEKNRCEINFVISAHDENGTRYYRWQKYQIADVLYGFQFVPLQGHEYCDKRFFLENQPEEDFVKCNGTLYAGKELFRYQHFDKVYPLQAAVIPSEKHIKKDILLKKQVIKGQYKGLRQKLLDMCSWIIMFFLDKSHWKER